MPAGPSSRLIFFLCIPAAFGRLFFYRSRPSWRGFLMLGASMPKSRSYEEFVDKFKSEKTTGDCYTPPEVYDAVLAWVRDEYGGSAMVSRLSVHSGRARITDAWSIRMAASSWTIRRSASWPRSSGSIRRMAFVFSCSLHVRISWSGKVGNRHITSFFPVDPNWKEKR